MKEDLLNVFGSFSEISLDCIEKQNEEIEQLQQENKQLKEELEKIKQPTIFIDTQDIEERYGEQLYQDYLVEQNKYLQQKIDKTIEYIEKRRKDNVGCKLNFIEVDTVLEILKGSDSYV